jgi:outer membrane protein assembly factor BamB
LYSQQVEPVQVLGGLVYVIFGTKLFALDTTAGATRWTFTSSTSQALGVPMINNGVLFVGDSGPSGEFYSINASTGSVVWQVSLPNLPSEGNGYIFPVFYNNNLYLNLGPGLFVLNASNGATVFSTSYQGSISAQQAPLIYNNAVYVICVNHMAVGNTEYDSLLAINAATGQRLWGYSIPGTATPPDQCRISGNTIYFGATNDTNTYVFGVDATAGNMVAQVTYWSNHSPYCLENCTISGSNLYTSANINSGSPEFSSYNLKTNSLNWVSPSVNTSDSYDSYGQWTQPTISNGTIYVEGFATETYALVAVDSATGTIKWSNTTISSEMSPVVVTSKGNVHYTSSYILTY